MGSAREDIRARLIFPFFFFLSLSLGIPHAALKLPGFKNPTTEIPTPPSDHIPLRRCCAFGARKREDRLTARLECWPPGIEVAGSSGPNWLCPRSGCLDAIRTGNSR